MSVLIVESDRKLAALWAGHLRRCGLQVCVVRDVDDAFRAVSSQEIEVLVVDLDLHNGDALTIADFASYRRPEARVIFVTASSFFSDGSIFQIIPNAAGYLASGARPEDLAAIVEHHVRPTRKTQSETPSPVTPAHAALLGS